MYQCPYLLSFNEFGKIAFLIHIEHDDRHVAFTAKSESRLVHDLETVLDRLVKAKFIIFDSRRILFRVCSIYSIHARTFKKSVRSDLQCAESRT